VRVSLTSNFSKSTYTVSYLGIVHNCTKSEIKSAVSRLGSELQKWCFVSIQRKLCCKTAGTQSAMNGCALCKNFWEDGRRALDAWSVVVRGGEMPDFGRKLNY
jgi:hypothetical protein